MKGIPSLLGSDADTDEADTTDGTPQKPGTREQLKTALGAMGIVLAVAGFWYAYWTFLGTTITVLSVLGFFGGVAMLPLGFWFFPVDVGGVGRLFDWFGAATIGAWGLYLNSRERQEFVPVDDGKGVAYTSDGDVHFDLEESTEYQVGKRPFFLLHYLDDESAERTYRDGTAFEDGDEAKTVPGKDSSEVRLFDRYTMGGQMQLATRVDPDTDSHLIDRKRFLSRFENATGASLTRKAKQKVQKEEGGTMAGGIQRNQLLAMAMGAVTALIASVIM